MSGVEVIGELLGNDAALLQLVPAAQIKGGRLPAGSPLPGVVVTEVSGVDRQPLKQGETRHVTDRVRVSALAADYRTQKLIIRRIRTACAGKRGDFAGVTKVSVVTDARGPDFEVEADGAEIFAQSQDFRVSYNETA